MRRFLRTTAIGLALGFFLPVPGPVTGLVFNPAAYADPYTGAIPSWIKSSCCGPRDVRRLRPDQISDMGDYYVVDDYHERIPKRLHDGKPDPRIMPSQDGDYWIFYADNAAGWQGGMYGSHPYYQNTSQNFYCLFIPMAF